MLNFSTFPVNGCRGQVMLLFWKLVQQTQTSKPLETSRHHNPTKLLVFPPLRVDLLCTLYYETPCRKAFSEICFHYSDKIRSTFQRSSNLRRTFWCHCTVQNMNEICQIFRSYFGNTMASKYPFEITWALSKVFIEQN